MLVHDFLEVKSLRMMRQEIASSILHHTFKKISEKQDEKKELYRRNIEKHMTSKFELS